MISWDDFTEFDPADKVHPSNNDPLGIRREPRFGVSADVYHRFAYSKLDEHQRQLVNQHLQFRQRARLRKMAKLFARQPPIRFLLEGRYACISISIEKERQGTLGIPRMFITIKPAMTRDDIDDVTIDLNLPPQPHNHSRSPQSVDITINCPGIAIADRKTWRTPGFDPSYLCILPGSPGALGRFGRKGATNWRILEGVTKWMMGRRLNIQIDQELAETQSPLPDGLKDLRLFRRQNFAICPVFGDRARVKTSSLELDYWLLSGTCPDQAIVIAMKRTAEEYLNVYKDAFDKLINTQFLRFTQCYSAVNDCLESVSIIPQLVHHILQSPLPSTPDRRRLVIIDTQISANPLPQEKMDGVKMEMERMMEGLMEEMDNRGYPDVQIHTLDEDLPPRKSSWFGQFFPTGIQLIISQQYQASLSSQSISTTTLISHQLPSAIGYRALPITACNVRRIRRRFPAHQQSITP
ncbi:unnamed protein product, partial [Mesorhabditis spiculigera]